ncbi:hypothetical protein EG329_008556 [Mollisiaceae sp. DMI_Dod_QoI]|nr:hypothetical protein EG329_008556 [Helotiales sp. DMI_Dod_QoI]
MQIYCNVCDWVLVRQRSWCLRGIKLEGNRPSIYVDVRQSVHRACLTALVNAGKFNYQGPHLNEQSIEGQTEAVGHFNSWHVGRYHRNYYGMVDFLREQDRRQAAEPVAARETTESTAAQEATEPVTPPPTHPKAATKAAVTPLKTSKSGTPLSAADKGAESRGVVLFVLPQIHPVTQQQADTAPAALRLACLPDYASIAEFYLAAPAQIQLGKIPHVLNIASTVDNRDGGSPIIPRQWTNGLDVSAIGWCCDFPLANGSCAQGFEIKIQAGTVLPNATTSSTSSGTRTASNTATAPGQHPATNSTCKVNHDVAIGAGIGVPLGIAAVSLALLWLRERRIRKKEKAEAAAYVQASHEKNTFLPSSEVPGDSRHTPSELGGMQRYGELP